MKENVPAEMGKAEIEEFLTVLGHRRRTRRWAAILPLQKDVLESDPGWLDDVVLAKRSHNACRRGSPGRRSRPLAAGYAYDRPPVHLRVILPASGSLSQRHASAPTTKIVNVRYPVFRWNLQLMRAMRRLGGAFATPLMNGYTAGMKAAISIADEACADAERLARRVRKSRSQLHTEAVAEYVAHHDPEAVRRDDEPGL